MIIPTCIKCNIALTDSNWHNSLQSRGHKLCKSCKLARRRCEYLKSKEYSNIILSTARYARNTKSQVINKYGGICKNCGISDLDILTIDHVYNDGNLHRQETRHIYLWLKANGYPSDGYQVLCYNCNCSKNILYKDKNNLKNKLIVLDHYGRKCVYCSEDRIERLTIDHINDDGNIKRKLFAHGTGAKFYRWIIKNKFPEDLQILCFNCNCRKRIKYNLL